MATTKTITSPSGKLAKKALSTMNNEMIEICREIGSIKAKLEAGCVMAVWEIGKRVDAIMREPEKYGEDDVDAITERLAAAVNISKQYLERYRIFSITYSDRNQVKALLERKTETGQGISWSHINELLRVPEKMRPELTDKVFDQDLSVLELKSEIQRKLGKRGAAKGRPRVGIKTPIGAVAVIFKQASDDADIIASVMPQFDKVNADIASFASEDFLSDLTEALTQARTSQEAYGDLISTLESVERSVAKTLRFAKNQTQADLTSSKATVRARAAEAVNGTAPRKKVVVTAKKKATAK